MADFIDIYASDDDGFTPNGFFIGNPAGHAFLLDDSNSQNGVPDDWTAEPQLRATKRGAFVIVISNIEVDVAICGPEETPDQVAYVRMRVAVNGISQYAAQTAGGRSRVFVRRSAA